jgi:hypothetical protein
MPVVPDAADVTYRSTMWRRSGFSGVSMSPSCSRLARIVERESSVCAPVYESVSAQLESYLRTRHDGEHSERPAGLAILAVDDTDLESEVKERILHFGPGSSMPTLLAVSVDLSEIWALRASHLLQICV